MKKTVITLTLIAALMLSLAGCGKSRTAESRTPAPQITADVQAPAQSGGQAAPSESDAAQTAPSATEEPAAEPARQDGERFEDVIILEGMEETVRYEHIRNQSLGIEMDYDYESFVRDSDANRERILSVWDDPENPENYLELTYSPETAETAAASVAETLSNDYEIIEEAYTLAHAGSCIRIDTSEVKGGGWMPEHLQTVYIVPAPDGCRIGTVHCAIEAAEGMGRRFAYMMNTLTVIERSGAGTLSEDQALSAIRNYCFAVNPDLEELVKSGEYPVYWELASSDAQEIVVLFRSYTGVLTRYYIDRSTGETYVTEFVPGITPEEARTEESLNVWDYAG